MREIFKSAIAIKNVREAKGRACLYRLSEPLAGYEYVVVSAAKDARNDYGQVVGETFIFGSDESGRVKSFLELPGSYRGGLDHQKALNDAGYDINFGENFR
jgi:hypothetical protein|tara:strand:- start:150 stop:452 length:303 start_codon:yes stop_codon:yes gene_type:complete